MDSELKRDLMDNFIVTVAGVNHVGIVAGVSTALSHLDVSIINISQTLVGDYFTMIMECTLGAAEPNLTVVQETMSVVGAQLGVDVRVQSESIFDAMHRM
ncbi:MAG: ACT domain-containing protein [Propionibacterium sp.]|nr:ACT domain-containing protein [Propionibacterium sp.]MDN6793549.1 ACT domain-containing protein [Propionibacterium sp.]